MLRFLEPFKDTIENMSLDLAPFDNDGDSDDDEVELIESVAHMTSLKYLDIATTTMDFSDFWVEHREGKHFYDRLPPSLQTFAFNHPGGLVPLQAEQIAEIFSAQPVVLPQLHHLYFWRPKAFTPTDWEVEIKQLIATQNIHRDDQTQNSLFVAEEGGLKLMFSMQMGKIDIPKTK